MTSLRKQMDNAITRLLAIQDKLQSCDSYPPCCLTFHRKNQISCDVLGPMPEKVFLLHCKECQKLMKELLGRVSKSVP